RRREPPRRDGFDRVMRQRLPERIEKASRIAFRRAVRIEARDNRLQRMNGATPASQRAHELDGDESLADLRARRRDEERAHVRFGASSRDGISAATAFATAATSSGEWAAENAKRSRAVPSGTVGGRIAVTRKPWASSAALAASARSALP